MLLQHFVGVCTAWSTAGVPSIAEAGYPDLAADIWTAVLAPAGTPKGYVGLFIRAKLG